MIVETDSVEMAIQEWFYLHPWGYWMYWIIGIPSVYYGLIYCLQRIDRLIVRLPHSLSGSIKSGVLKGIGGTENASGNKGIL